MLAYDMLSNFSGCLIWGVWFKEPIHSRLVINHKLILQIYRMFGLRNELVYHLLTLPYFCLVCELE
jgi:hypothetical protein